MKIHCAYSKIESIDNIKLNPLNSNKHPDGQIDLIAHSLKEHGWRRPILIGSFTGTVIAGEGRYLAAYNLNLTDIPVDVQEFESKEAEYKYLETDNNTTKNSEWDQDKFELNLKELKIDDFNKEDFGLLEFEFKDEILLPEDFNTDDDKIDLKSFASLIRKELNRIKTQAMNTGLNEVDAGLKAESFIITNLAILDYNENPIS